MFRAVVGRLLKRKRPVRLLWILNHKTLLPAEVPILESLGAEVFVPSKAPENDQEFVSATARYRGALTIPDAALSKLDAHSFYDATWDETLIQIINDNFDAVITPIYQVPLEEAVKHYKGPLITRIFGREYDLNYDGVFSWFKLTDKIRQAGDRFCLAAAYPNIVEIEPDFYKTRSSTVGCAIPPSIWKRGNTWKPQNSRDLLFLCPKIKGNPYYTDVYNLIKGNFADFSHKIMGPQTSPVDDPTVIGFIDDDELFDLYATAAAFVYTSIEKRHLHYSPLEAIIIGTPTLYMKGGMLSTIAGSPLPGECSSISDMRKKAEILLSGPSTLCDEIIQSQKLLLGPFRTDRVRNEWRTVFERFGLKVQEERFTSQKANNEMTETLAAKPSI